MAKAVKSEVSPAKTGKIKNHTPDWRAPKTYFDLKPDHPLAERLASLTYVWEILERLPTWIGQSIQPNVAAARTEHGLISTPTAIIAGETLFGVQYNLSGPHGFQVWDQDLPLSGAALILPGAFIGDDQVEIGPGALIEPGAMIKGPTILGPGTEVRQGAYVRGGVWATREVVIGHATEAKNVLLLDGAKAGHFAYLGDSVLGRGVNLGAGAKLANLLLDNGVISFKGPGEEINLQIQKMGAILGDHCVTGCNSVTNPGTLMGPDSRLWPNRVAASGYHPAGSKLNI
ncbi:MAG: hypothetical protein LBT86_00720 [Deltaproteobacteria bacterium]|nr:hypothetical protein [Deltaproteobacteria bacterium]